MALIIEDGTIVAGANSFATVGECKAYAVLRGLDLPTADIDVEILLIKATDYLNSVETKYQGDRYDEDQELCFPREDIYLFAKYIGGDVPRILKDGQCQLAVDVQENDLQAPGSGKEVIEEGVGPLRTKFNPNGSTSPQFDPVAALAFLAPLFRPGANGGINLISYK